MLRYRVTCPGENSKCAARCKERRRFIFAIPALALPGLADVRKDSIPQSTLIKQSESEGPSTPRTNPQVDAE